MIKTFGHQTIEKTSESIGDRIKEGPIISIEDDGTGKPKKHPPFAGDGYYFWEDNIEAAEWWGFVRYEKKSKGYRIFRIDITLRYDDNSLFDIVGNRQHLNLLKRLIEKTKIAVDCTEWKLHNFIKYFRVLESKHPGMFPYKLMRFNDFAINPKIQSQIFLDNFNRFALLNPFYIICVFDKTVLPLNSFIFIK